MIGLRVPHSVAGMSTRPLPITSEPAPRLGLEPVRPIVPRPDAGEIAALGAYRRAVAASAGYRDHLARVGMNPESVERFADVPFIDKQIVFGDGVDRWLEGGRLADAGEVLLSSGLSGQFSVGVTSRAEQITARDTLDAALTAAGAGPYTSSLVINCLPMGISLPTTLATVANPSVHLEMAQEVHRRLGPDFDRVMVVAEPVFMKELAERIFAERGPRPAPFAESWFVGGEWVSEPWRQYVEGLLGGTAGRREGAGILISMGAAELGLHLLFETPELRVARAALDDSPHGRELFARDLGYTPNLFTFDPRRIHLETREHADGATTLAGTTLSRRLLPLVRYDLDDLGEIIPAARVNAFLADTGARVTVDGPIVAMWGRRGAAVTGPGWTLRPEQLKDRLFRGAANAACLTGRFFIEASGARPAVHLQLRPATVATPNLATDVAAQLATLIGVTSTVTIHPHADYPFHLAGDFQHKPRYGVTQP